MGSIKRAAIYARRSTEQQEASLDRQITECERLIESLGLTLVQVFAETGSAWRKSERPSFEAMLRAAEAREFEVLVVWEMSRLSRQTGDTSSLAIMWDLQARGVEVLSVIEPTIGVLLADEMSLLIKSHMARDESDTKSQRVKSGKVAGILRGVHQGAWPCFGYDDGTLSVGGNGKAHKVYEADAEAAAIVNDIFVAYADRAWSPQQIADWLNERSVAPPRPHRAHPMKRRAEPMWHQSTIRGLIPNPLLAGWATYKGQRVKACDCASIADAEAGRNAPASWRAWDDCPHPWVESANVPGIVERDLWERAQRVIAARAVKHIGGRGNRGSSDRFLLAGMLWCDECGERIGTRTDQRRGRNIKHRYVCRGRRLGKCELPPIPQDVLDEEVRRSFVTNFVDQVDVQSTIERERARLVALRSSDAMIVRDELDHVEHEVIAARSLIVRAQRDYESGAITPDQWSRLDRDAQGRRDLAEQAADRLRKRLAHAEASIGVGEIDALLDRLATVTRMISGRLHADDVPQLNLQLAEVFDEFRVSKVGDRLIVEPRLRPEFSPEGEWKMLDFGDDLETGETRVEVVDYLEPNLRKVDLTRRDADISHGSSSTTTTFVEQSLRIEIPTESMALDQQEAR